MRRQKTTIAARQKATLKYAKEKEILPLDTSTKSQKARKLQTLQSLILLFKNLHTADAHIDLFGLYVSYKRKRKAERQVSSLLKHGIKIVTRRIGIISFGRRSREE